MTWMQEKHGVEITAGAVTKGMIGVIVGFGGPGIAVVELVDNASRVWCTEYELRPFFFLFDQVKVMKAGDAQEGVTGRVTAQWGDNLWTICFPSGDADNYTAEDLELELGWRPPRLADRHRESDAKPKPEVICSLPGCRKPNDGGSRSCWNCGGVL